MFLTPLIGILPRSASAQPRRVVLILAQPSALEEVAESELGPALRAQLRELSVEVVVVSGLEQPLARAAQRARRFAKSEHALAVIWLELRASKLSIFVYDAKQHLYAREVEADGSAASRSEAIAIILRSAIGALLEGQAVAMEEVALPAPPVRAAPLAARPPQRPRGRTETATEASLGASYAGVLFAHGAAWQHGASALLSLAPRRSPWFFGVDYTYFAPLRIEGDGAVTRLRRHPLEAFAGMRTRSSSPYFDVRTGLTADYLSRATERVGDGLRATSPSGRWLWSLSARLGLAVPMAPRVLGVLNVGADFLLNPFDQVISATNVGNQVVGSPLVVRPRLELGLLISVW